MNTRSEDNLTRADRWTGFACTSIGLGCCIGQVPTHAQIDFAEPIDYPAISGVAHIRLVHMNADEHLDLVMLHEFGDITVYLNQGNGADFSYALHLGPGDRDGADLATGDINGDGFGDFAWIDWGNVYVFLNNGTGRGGQIVEVTGLLDWPDSLALGDLDDDGDLDLVVGTNDDVEFFHNQSNQAFERADSAPMPADSDHSEDCRLGDIDGDGDLDAVVLGADARYDVIYGYKIYGSAVAVFLNDGAGFIEALRETELPYGSTYDDLYARSLVIADFDNDRSLDIAVGAVNVDGTSKDAIGFHDNLGDGRFSHPAGLVWLKSGKHRYVSMSASDLELDGDIDLTVLRADANNTDPHGLHVIENLGHHRGFRIAQAFEIERGSAAVDTGDLNGDGMWDLVAGRAQGTRMFFNSSNFERPTLEVSELVREEFAEFVITDAIPYELVHVAVNRLGTPAPTRGIGHLGGLTLDLGRPIYTFRTEFADGEGRAVSRFPIIKSTSRGRYVFQAFIPYGQSGGLSLKSNFVTRMLTH